MITIVDYGMGNLQSVSKAFEQLGAQVVLTQNPQEIIHAEKLVVPGVGGFGNCMRVLKEKKLDQAIVDFIKSGRPYLGICLGMQILMERGYEFGEHAGLGIFKGDVVGFNKSPALKVPHMGWNSLHFKKKSRLFKDIPDGSQTYFVHSFYVKPLDEGIIAATCDYDVEFCAAIETGNIYATQFHPEKSQRVGLKLLENFYGI